MISTVEPAWPSDNRRMTSSPPAPAPLKAIIFDCDGTLVDSETSGMTALHEEACKLGYSQAQALDDFRGRRMSLCIEMIEARIGRPAPTGFMATVRLAMADKFRAGIVPMPGAPQLLQALRRAGLPYCIASNGPQDKMELTLALSGLQSYFEKHVFSAYEIGHWKPSPELFFHAARAMGVEAIGCAVVEDSLPGIAAGLAAGMRVYSMCERKTVPAELAARVVQIDGLADLHAAFGLNSSL